MPHDDPKLLRHSLGLCDQILDQLESCLVTRKKQAEANPIFFAPLLKQVRRDIRFFNALREDILWKIQEHDHGKKGPDQRSFAAAGIGAG